MSGEEAGELRERMAHLEGLLEGLREAPELLLDSINNWLDTTGVAHRWIVAMCRFAAVYRSTRVSPVLNNTHIPLYIRRKNG